METRTPRRHGPGICGCGDVPLGCSPAEAASHAVDSALLRTVGAGTLLAALGDLLPLGGLRALAQDRAAPEKPAIKAGFLPLTCAAPIVIGHERGIYAKHGVTLELIKVPGIALIHDRMLAGELDISQQVMPVALSTSAGVGGAVIPTRVLTVLNQNGNALVLANRHRDNRDPRNWKDFRFAVPFEHAHQNLQLRAYLANAGLDPDRDVSVRVTPPTEYVSQLRAVGADRVGGEAGEPVMRQDGCRERGPGREAGMKLSGKATSAAPWRAASAIASQAFSTVASASIQAGARCAAATLILGSDMRAILGWRRRVPASRTRTAPGIPAPGVAGFRRVVGLRRPARSRRRRPPRVHRSGAPPGGGADGDGEVTAMSVEPSPGRPHKPPATRIIVMPQRRNAGADPVEEAAALARTVAPDLDAVLLTHFADPDTLDVLRPGETDIARVAAVNRAVAREMAAAGVEVLVQKADRAAFRRWMTERDDTPEIRRRWIDRGRLLRGAEAQRLLGIEVTPTPGRPGFGRAPGPIADRLLAAFDAEDPADFDDLAEALLAAGRDDVLDLAVRKMETAEGEEAAAEFEGDLLALAEAGRLGPSGWAALVALPVALQVDALPDAVALAESLLQSDVLPETAEVRFLPGWRSPDALAELPPIALRRVLLDMLAGNEPRDLPRGDTDELKQHGFGVLLGLQVDWTIPIWDEITASGGLPAAAVEEDGETPEEARRAITFDRWRAATFETSGSCVPLALVPPSEVGAEIADFLDEAEGHASGLEEIRDFVAVGRQEAGSEDILCRAEVVGEDLELSLYTERGRFLDALTVTADRLPVPAEDMPELLASFVRLVRDAPGR